MLAVVLCRTGTEQTVIPLTGLVQRTHALGHAINRSGGPQSVIVATLIGDAIRDVDAGDVFFGAAPRSGRV